MPDTRGAQIVPIPAARQGFLAPFRSVIADVSNFTWFTPGIPIAPQAPEGTQPRRLDYPTGINLSYVPRAEEQLTMDQLRNLAEIWDLLRLVLETRKDQIAGIPWVIRVRQDANEKMADYKRRADKDTARVQAATKLFQRPDGDHLWQTWIRLVLEELFVLDALSLYPFKDPTGTWRVDVLDGGTIKRLINAEGRTPMPPDAAYQQIIKGVPAHTFTSAQLLYRMRNARPWKLYGMSPVEQIVITVNLAIRRQLWKLHYYTVGNLPEAIAQVPDTWPPDKIKQFQEWWDSLLSGQLDARRKITFVPAFGGKDAIVFPKQDAIKDEMDEWLARVVCYAFSVSPQPFIREGMSRYGVQTQQQMAKAEGLLPLLSWLSETFTDVIETSFGFTGLEFVFQEEMESDMLKRAQIQEIRVRAGISKIDEVREENGDEPINVGAGVITGAGFVPFGGQVGAPDIQPGMLPPGTPGSRPGGGGSDGGGQRGDSGVQPRGGASTPGGDVVKAGGGRHAFATPTQEGRRADLDQMLVTFFAHVRREVARRVVVAYTPYAPDDQGHNGPPSMGQRKGNGNGENGHRVKKITTTGIRQTLNVAADGLEGEMVIPKPVINPIAVGVTGDPLIMERALAEQRKLQESVADWMQALREQRADDRQDRLDLQRRYDDRFARLETLLTTRPEPQPPPAPAPITVNVEAPPPAPVPPPAAGPEIHTHVEIPKEVVKVEPGAVVVHTPEIPTPKAPIVNIAAPAPSPAPVVQVLAPIVIKNKSKRPRSKTKIVMAPELKVPRTRKKVNRNPLGDVESIDTIPLDPQTGQPKDE